MKTSEAANPDLRLTELEMIRITLGPVESSLQKKDKMVTYGNHRLLFCSLLDIHLGKNGFPGNCRWCVQIWIPGWLTLEFRGGWEYNLTISFPTSPYHGLPLSLPFLQKCSFSLQSCNIVKLQILCLMCKGTNRPLSEVNCCYGCLCLLNIMTVLWVVMPLWLSCLKQKHSASGVCLKHDHVVFKAGTHILLWG